MIAVIRQQTPPRPTELSSGRLGRDRAPAAYLKAKTALEVEAKKRKSLRRDEYGTLCKKYRLDSADRRALLAYLKQLGTLFHYQSSSDSGPLPETYVLDPTWVTKGVYAILTDPTLRERGGELEPADLRRIFAGKRNYPRNSQDFILAMMEADPFELCFPVPDPPIGKAGLRLIPELLPPNEPDHGIEPATSMNLEYHYSHLPAGLIPRFIVRMHNAVSKRTYWKNGVVLLIDGRRVLVRGSREEKKVFISVEDRETASRRALAVVRQNLSAVHAAMRHLKWSEMVSLSDDPGVTISYSDLEQYEREEGPQYSFRPPGAKRKYSVRELLEGIEEYRDLEDDVQSDEKAVIADAKGKVFVSYAWENEARVEIVRKLADDLRASGVDAWIDQYEGEMGPPEGWPNWMAKMIEQASAVLIVCSPKYLRRVKKEETPGVGLGATWEAHLIHQHLYESGAVTDKFRAVLVDRSDVTSIPTTMRAHTYFTLSDPDGFERLFRALTGQPRVIAPPLGVPRKMPPI